MLRPVSPRHTALSLHFVHQEEFLALADRIAASYAGFNASAGACEAISSAGAAFALKDAPANLAFFSVRLPDSLSHQVLCTWLVDSSASVCAALAAQQGAWTAMKTHSCTCKHLRGPLIRESRNTIVIMLMPGPTACSSRLSLLLLCLQDVQLVGSMPLIAA